MRFLLYLLLFFPAGLSACFCVGSNHFCDYTKDNLASYPDNVVVMRGRLDDYRTYDEVGYFPLYDFEIIEVLVGDYSEPFVSLIGYDGSNCNGPLSNNRRLVEGNEYIVLFVNHRPHFSSYGIEDLPNRYPVHDYPGCGNATLELINGMVSGSIMEGVSSVHLSELLPLLEECLDIELDGPDDLFDLPNHSVNVFPNPTNGLFFVEFKEPAPVDGIKVFDANGRLISEEQLEGKIISRHEVVLDRAAPGVYQVFMEAGGISVRKRVVVF